MRFLRAFSAFWYDFLIGERPELFVGPVLVFVVIAVTLRAGLGADLAAVVLTLLVLLTGAASVALAVRSKRRAGVRRDRVRWRRNAGGRA